MARRKQRTPPRAMQTMGGTKQREETEQKERILHGKQRKNKDYYVNNIEHIQEQKHKHFEENEEEIFKKNRDYYANNKENILKQKAEYYEKRKEIITCDICGSCATKDCLVKHKKTPKCQSH